MITVLTDPAVGGTFLTWSLHFLAGHDSVYSTKKKSFVKLTHTPLTEINAHNFRPNQPTNINQFIYNINCLTAIPTDNFHTLYFHNLDDCNRTRTGTTSSAIDTSKSLSKKHIYLSLDKKNALYNCMYKQRTLTVDNITGQRYKTFDEQHNGFIEQYFSKDKQNFDKLKLSNVWDYREFLALNIRPFDIVKMTDTSKFDFDYYYVDTFDLYNYFDCFINTLFDYLDIKVDNSRRSQWLDIYRSWQQLHANRVQFVYYFDQIIDHIVSGKYFDLSRFRLDIMQEAAIQHILLYKHNLNFQTWQLEKFTNTQQLHNLLEPNIHTLTSNTSS